MIEYGIKTSKAHVWVHVCPLDACFYFYSRARMVVVLDRFPEAVIASARGRLVRLHGNRDCDGGFIRSIERPYGWFNAFGWKDAASDCDVGEIAERMFQTLINEQGFPFPIQAHKYAALDDQYQGKDFRVTPRMSHFDVEVKADIRGGEWGTGNLFVQTHEGGHQWAGRNAHKALRA